MLKSGISTNLYAHLDSSFPLTTQTLTSTGLGVALEPNSSYEFRLTFTSTDGGDNLRFKLVYTGSFTKASLFYDTSSGILAAFSIAGTYAPTSEDAVTVWGYLRTSTAGKFELQARKDTLLSGDATLITGGAHMIARKL